MDQWEYHVEPWNRMITAADDLTLERKLNGLGREGWELVNIIPQISGFEGSISVEFNQLIFKRKK